MNNCKEEVWGFNYGSMCALNLKFIGLLKINPKYGICSTYSTKREALEALATRLKQLMDEEDE
jgi:hypothetical protein